jgi:two-component system sensor histidine kinase KdpD
VGLGLAVARGLTEAMGGTLTAEDTPGGGLTMMVELPRAGRGDDRPGAGGAAFEAPSDAPSDAAADPSAERTRA